MGRAAPKSSSPFHILEWFRPANAQSPARLQRLPARKRVGFESHADGVAKPAGPGEHTCALSSDVRPQLVSKRVLQRSSSSGGLQRSAGVELPDVDWHVQLHLRESQSTRARLLWS